MTKEEYKEYLKSEHWHNLRIKKGLYSKKKRHCSICNSKENLDLHHIVYKKIFDVETCDLRWLCRRCHELTHKLLDEGVIKFKETHNSNVKFCLTKFYVKEHLGLRNINLFHTK